MSVVFVRGTEEFDSGVAMQGLNLLAHAQMIELSLGSECGGHGKCGKDRVRVPAEDRPKTSPVTAIERAHLRPEEIEAGIRLGCQCFPESDGVRLRVFLPPR
jgi:ferredoxin